MKDIDDGTEVLMEYEEATKLTEDNAGDRIAYIRKSLRSSCDASG